MKNRAILLLVLAAALSSAALSLHAIGNVVARAVALAAAGNPLTPATLLPALGLIDAALAVLTLLALARLVHMEWRDRAITGFLNSATPGQMLVFLAALVAWLGHSFLFPGMLLTSDSASHVVRFNEVRIGLEAGFLPQWSNYQYLGSPLLTFTGPMTYVLGGALDLLIRDPMLTAKVWLFALHLGTGLAFYAFLSRLGLTRSAALVASVAWSGSFAYLHLFLYRGLIPQAATILLLVLLFLAAEGLMQARRLRPGDWLLFTLATGALIINHQPHAPFAALYLAVFGGVSLATGRWQARSLPFLVSAGILGVVISAVAVFPLIDGAAWVMMEADSGFAKIRIPTLERLLRLVLWRNTRSNWGPDYWAYIGLVSVLLAWLGGWAALSRRLGGRRRHIALATLPCLILSFFLANPVVRDIMFLGFFAAIFTALGFEAIALSSRLRGRTAVTALALMLLDVASTAVLPVARPGKEYQAEAGKYLQAVAPNERSVEIYMAADGKMNALTGPEGLALNSYATVQRISGHHNMAAPLAHNYIETTASRAERDLKHDGRLSPATYDLLAVLNVHRIICLGTFTNGCPSSFKDAVTEGVLGATVKIPDASPVMFSRRLVQLSPPDGMDKPALWDPTLEADPMEPRVQGMSDFLDTYRTRSGLNVATHLATALPVRTLPAPSAAMDDSTPWNPALTQYDVSLTTVALTITTDQPGYVQLSHPWYPGTDVTINGSPVAPLRGATNLMVLALPKGESVIHLSPRNTPAMKISAAVSGAGLLIAFAVTGLMMVRQRQTA